MPILTLGFSKAKSPWKIGSRVIQEVEKRDFSHAYVLYDCPITSERMVSQASHGFVNETSYRLFLEQNIPCIHYNLYVNNEKFELVFKFIRSNLGQKYSYSQLAIIGLKKLFGAELDIKNNDYICSEWVAEICKILSIPIGYKMQTVTPSDLNEALKKAGLKHELP
jgi:hypothetical protein